ncbi:hypothetical protein GCM10028798_36100 [Humibacter antri]
MQMVLGGQGTVTVRDGTGVKTVRVSGVPREYVAHVRGSVGAGTLEATVGSGVKVYSFTFGRSVSAGQRIRRRRARPTQPGKPLKRGTLCNPPSIVPRITRDGRNTFGRQSLGVLEMNNFTKRAGMLGGAAALATGLVVGGMAIPANASTPSHAASSHSSDSATSVSPRTLDYLSFSDVAGRLHLMPRTDVGNGTLVNGSLVNGPLVGPVASGDTVGDVASGNPIASGNEVNGNAVASGNSTGNDNSVPVASGDSTLVASGNATSAGNGDSVTAPIGSGNTASLKNLGAALSSSVDNTVDNALNSTAGLGGLLGR